MYDLPAFNLGSDTTICYGEYFDLSVADLGIAGLDSTNWYSTNQGALLLNSETLSFEVLEKDTLIAEVFNMNGCVNYDSLIVSMYDLPAFNLGADTTICYGEYFALSVSDLGIAGLDSTNWYSTTQGELLLNSETLSFEVLEKDTLIAEVFNANGCVNYDSLIVSMYDLPAFNLGSDTTICYGEYFALSVSDLGIAGLDSTNWYSTNQGALLLNSETLSFEVLEKDTLIAEVFNMNGCVHYDSLIVSMYDLPAFNLGSDTTICYGEYFALSVSDLGIAGLDSTNWYSTNQGALLLNSETLSFEVLEKDTLIAEVFNMNGCVHYDSLIVSMYDLPAFNLGSDTTICYGEYFDLSVSDLGIAGLDSTNWYSTNQGVLLLNSETLSFEVLEKDTLIAEVFNMNGCVHYDSLIVSMYDLPAFNLGSDTTICYGEYFALSVSDLGIEGLDSTNWYSTNQGALLLNSETLSFEVLEKDTLIAEVFNMNGCVHYDSLIVSMYDLLVFNIGSDTSICYGSSILLKTGFGFDEVNWYSEDGTVLEEDSWFYNYTVDVSDVLVAEVYDVNRCLNYDTLQVDMDPLPDYTIGEDLAICYGDSASLSITGSWTDVSWYTVGNQLLHDHSTEYKYKVEETLEIWTEVYSDKSCLQRDTIEVTSLDLPEFDLSGEAIYCYSESINLEVAVGEVFEWRGQDGTLLSSSAKWQALAESSGEISLYVEDANACHYSDTLTLTVHALPDFTIEGESEICYGDSTDVEVNYALMDSISWYDETMRVGDDDAQLRFSASVDTWLYADLTDVNQCLNTDSLLIVVHDRPVAAAGPDSLMCFGTQISLGTVQTEPDWAYTWRPSLTLSDPSAAQPLAFPEEDTEYTLEIVNGEGCNARDTVMIHVNPEIVVDAGVDEAICLGEMVSLGTSTTASGSQFDYSYEWTSANLNASLTDSNPKVSPDTTSTYYLNVSSGYCPEEKDTITIVVNYAPEITVSPQQSVGADESVTIEATGGVEYLWYPEVSLDDPTLAAPEASPLETVTYSVVVTDVNGCESTGEVTVLVQNVIFIPNLFTPNGDQNNDQFMVYGSGIAALEFQVFDLNGNEVYHTSDIEEATTVGWNGSYRGEPLPNGMYIWTIRGSFHDGRSLKFEGNTKGAIRLLR
ncbi:gliding motility-associated C-terminal domain-containing protein [Reichenbachiella sp. MSK19-1]|uniref:T9SS type B sorting domain-containing protein n=1 Tax=Reichenbachiella sp. MSK19-1 TaxID=1897631 RepID=UPI0011C3CD39|nr:gliding motility-associated C-terminal domain-containing protein [Reichenbachiella sp. MSK19-1]